MRTREHFPRHTWRASDEEAQGGPKGVKVARRLETARRAAHEHQGSATGAGEERREIPVACPMAAVCDDTWLLGHGKEVGGGGGGGGGRDPWVRTHGARP